MAPLLRRTWAPCGQTPIILQRGRTFQKISMIAALVVAPQGQRVSLYFTLQESSVRQATWGKRKLGLCVVTATGDRLSRTRAFIRALVKLLPWQLAHTSIYHIPGWPLAPEDLTPFSMVGLILVWVLVGSYALSALISKTHRTPYDWVSGAYVVNIPPAR